MPEGSYLSEAERRRLTPEHHFKNVAEIKALFADLPEAIDNTLVVARLPLPFPDTMSFDYGLPHPRGSQRSRASGRRLRAWNAV